MLYDFDVYLYSTVQFTFVFRSHYLFYDKIFPFFVISNEVLILAIRNIYWKSRSDLTYMYYLLKGGFPSSGEYHGGSVLVIASPHLLHDYYLKCC